MRRIPEEPGISWWLTFAGIALAIVLGVALVTPVRAEVPLPRPKPQQCISPVSTWEFAGFIEEGGHGDVIYLAGDELRAWLVLYNRIPPRSHYTATSAIVLAPSSSILLAGGRTLPAGSRDMRMFDNGCLVAHSVFREGEWKKLADRVEKLRGQPV